jgi:hypothetical protein
MLLGALADGPAKKGGIAFVEHIDDAVIIDGLAALADVSAAGGTNEDLLRDRLAAGRAEFHGGILLSRLSKNGASGRDPALRGFCKCSHISPYAALSKTPRAWADGPILVFQRPARSVFITSEVLKPLL